MSMENHPERPLPRCPQCGVPGPVAFLHRPGEPDGGDIALQPRDHLLGRSERCDACIPGSDAVSRRHARLRWREGGFDLEDLKSTHGTFVNDIQLEPGKTLRLEPGDRVRLGDREFRYGGLAWESARDAGGADTDQTLQLVSDMMSLDPAVLVPRALALLRFVSGVERSYLVGAGTDPHLEGVLTSLDDPALRVSRTLVRNVLASGNKASYFVTSKDVAEAPSPSVRDLDLRRIWVSPVPGPTGRPVAAVYLDSSANGPEFDAATERCMDRIVELVGLAMRNASAHRGAQSLAEMLEREVADRVRDLDASRARLVAQDHLARLGRLVGAIAHEMNNPVGAITSLSQTLMRLFEPVLHLESDLEATFPDALDAVAAREVLDAAREAAHGPAIDTDLRRKREAELAAHFEAERVPSGETTARRLARAGLDVQAVEPALPLLRRDSGKLAALVERIFLFESSLGTIDVCAQQVARIVEGLKVYSQLDRARVENADLHQGIEVTLAVLAPRIPPGVRVETRFDAVEPFPHRPGELIQVWTNLVDNALHAMGETGTLRIETHDAAGVVRVTVEDTGSGIPADLGERIFDLDVTTRGPGAGLGLGLAICKTIVEESHGGRIDFESRPGRTVFAVHLPKAAVAAGSTGRAAHRAETR